jgi:hypothetical protein
MRVGIVHEYDEATEEGIIKSLDGGSYSFRRRSGSWLGIDRRQGGMPSFTHRARGDERELKEPSVGDGVIFISSSAEVTTWGYLQHVLVLITTLYGTRLIDVDL